MAYKCGKCDASFSVKMSLNNHKRLKHVDVREFACSLCDYVTIYKFNFETHIRSQHQKIKHRCIYCEKEFYDKSTMNRHVKQSHLDTGKNNQESNKRCITEAQENAFIKKSKFELNRSTDPDTLLVNNSKSEKEKTQIS